MKTAVIALLFINISAGATDLDYGDYSCKRIPGNRYLSGLAFADTWQVIRSRYPQGPRGESFLKQADCEQSLKVARENSNEVICTGSDLPLVGGYRLTDLWTGKTVQQKMEKDVCDRMAKKSKPPFACTYNYSSKEEGKDRKVTWVIVNTEDQTSVAGYEFQTDRGCFAKIEELAKQKTASLLSKENAPKPNAHAPDSNGKKDDPF